MGVWGRLLPSPLSHISHRAVNERKGIEEGASLFQPRPFLAPIRALFVTAEIPLRPGKGERKLGEDGKSPKMAPFSSLWRASFIPYCLFDSPLAPEIRLCALFFDGMEERLFQFAFHFPSSGIQSERRKREREFHTSAPKEMRKE